MTIPICRTRQDRVPMPLVAVDTRMHGHARLLMTRMHRVRSGKAPSTSPL